MAASFHFLVKRVEIDVGNEGTDNPALGAPDLAFAPAFIQQDTGLQEEPEQLKDAAVCDAFSKFLENQLMVEHVKTSAQVHINHPHEFVFADEFGDFRNGLMAATARPIGIAGGMKLRLKDRLQQIQQGLLNDTVANTGNS
jgi:hypothetical protein